MNKTWTAARFLSAIMSLMFACVGTPTWASDDKGKLKEEKIGANYVITDKYTHDWIKFPSVSGIDLRTGESVTIEPQMGEALVIFFLATWCIPCQTLAPSMKDLQQKYQKLNTQFIYVFSHDTEKDAKGFLATYQLEGRALVASDKTLQNFHQPELPSTYVGDRTNWLVSRSIKTKPADLAVLNEFLKVHTAL